MRKKSSQAPTEVVVFDGNPDHAWKALGLVTDWIKHAETKAGATLAAAGVVGGVLYNLVKSQTHPDFWLAVLSVACGAFVILTGLCVAISFKPRLRHKDEPVSPLYFNHIARQHETPVTYFTALHAVTASPESLVREIATQVWAISHVAHRKYTWASRGLVCLIGAVSFLTALAVLLGIRSLGD